jgi:hypothetical protein
MMLAILAKMLQCYDAMMLAILAKMLQCYDAGYTG